MLMSGIEDKIVALALIVGLYFPTSIDGIHSGLFYQISLVAALAFLSYLVWKHKTRPGALGYIGLPTMGVLIAGTIVTLLAHPFPPGWGTLTEYILLALLLSLDLRTVRPERFLRRALVLVNILGIGFGIAILAGNEGVSQFLTASYSQFYEELLPAMLALHKPVLTFGTHAVAGFFLYLFFWLNWETFTLRASKLAVCFAVSWLVLLAALTSFTAVGLTVLAVAQIGIWLWKHNRKLLTLAALCTLAAGLLAGRLLKEYVDISDIAEVAAGYLARDNVSGPLARYGPGGTERARIDYLTDHPLSPVGFAVPLFAATVDSGPVGYLVRGSVPLLLLVYFGLYKFLRYNLASRRHALTLLFVIVACETAFTALTYLRTFYLLPLVVIYLNHISPGMDYRVSGKLLSFNAQPSEGMS
jgi:hypothetical protein